MQRLVWWANVGLALVTLVAYVSPWVPPTVLWPAAFAALAFPTLVVLHLACMGWWVICGRGRVWLSFATLALGGGYLFEYVGFGESRDAAAPVDKTLTLVNYNLLGGRALYEGEREAFRQNMQAFAACVLDGTDVIAFEETPANPEVRTRLTETMDAAGLRYHFYAKDMVLSLHARYPLIDPRIEEDYNNYNGILTALVVPSPGDTLRVFAVHLQSNSVRISPTGIIRDAANANREAYWKLRSVAINYLGAARTRMKQAAALRSRIEASAYPVIVLGDLNDTPLSYAVNEIKRAGLEDSFRESGTGLGISYPGTIPGLRIDYVLGDEDFDFVSSEVLDCDWSDHKPVRAVVGY